MIQSSDYIFGIRAVMEAIEAGRDIDRVYIKKDLQGELAQQLADMIRANGIVSRRVPVERINKITRKNHQGVVAILSAVTYHSLDNLVPQLYEEGVTPLLMVLDGITDVRNFGAKSLNKFLAGLPGLAVEEQMLANGNPIQFVSVQKPAQPSAARPRKRRSGARKNK